MAGNPVFSYDFPLPPYADHQHDRRHQHQSFLGVLAHRQPDQIVAPNHPDVDLSDAIDHFLIELEVPGIKDAKDITCQWTSWRTLVISGSTTRSWQSPAEKINVSANQNGSSLVRMLSRESKAGKSEPAIDQDED